MAINKRQIEREMQLRQANRHTEGWKNAREINKSPFIQEDDKINEECFLSNFSCKCKNVTNNILNKKDDILDK